MGSLEFKDFYTYQIRTKNNRYITINDYSEGYAVSENIKGIYGYINKNGKEIILPDYKKVYDFHDGLARVKKTDGSYAFIDKNFKETFYCNYYYVGDFYNGLALIRKENGLFGYIDKTGKEVIPCAYKTATDFIYKDSITNEVYAQIYSYNDGNVYIDQKGNVVRNINKLDLKNKQKSNNLKPYKGINNLYGYKNEEGSLILPIHTEANNFSEGLAVVRDNNGNLRIINEAGNYKNIYTVMNIAGESEKDAVEKTESAGYIVESVKFDYCCSEIKIGADTILLTTKTESELRDKKIETLNKIKKNIDNLILSISGKDSKTKKIIK